MLDGDLGDPVIVLICTDYQVWYVLNFWTISDWNTWTTELLTTGPIFTLKQIRHEQMELTLAVNFQTNREVVMEFVALIFQVFLLARRIGLNINNVIRLIDYWNTVATTQRCDKWSNLLKVNGLDYAIGC